MESCQSTLFLTTNRIGSFDDAFISRIHISLYYPEFKEEERRKVWKIFFDKLSKERKDIMQVPIETKDYTQSKEVRALNWNGREIRNGKEHLHTTYKGKASWSNIYQLFRLQSPWQTLKVIRTKRERSCSRRHISCKLCACRESSKRT